MANQKLTDKTALGENTANDDVFMVVDTSDTTGSTVGTSKKVKSTHIIQTDKISLSNAEIIALDDGGGAGESQELVGAPGSGYAIIPFQVSIIGTYATTTETSNKNMLVGYDASQSVRYWTTFGRIMSSVASGTATYMQCTPTASAGVILDTIDNRPLKIWSNGTFNGGWSANVYVTYQIVKL